MVVRPMSFVSILQCDKRLDFGPRRPWPKAFPALAWQELLLTGFERTSGEAVGLDCTFLEAITSAYPELGLSEFARLSARVPPELQSGLAAAYKLRASERLEQTLQLLRQTPMVFQNWVDDKKLGARDVSVLAAVAEITKYEKFLSTLTTLNLSKMQAVEALDCAVELSLMGSLEILPEANERPADYHRRLQALRRPQSTACDEKWRKTVSTWPWPGQVQGHWQRFNDRSGVEIKIRATSPEDLQKKLARLNEIRETWSCTL